AAAAAAPGAQAPRHWHMLSPDGRMEFAVDTANDGRLTWRLTRDRQVVVAESPLGIRRTDQTFDARLTSLNSSPVTTIDDRYVMPYGKQREHHVIARQWTIAFANQAGAKLDV